MSNRIKGAALGLTIGGTDYWADVTKCEVDNEPAEAGVVTFQDAANGGSRQHFMNIGAIQSLQTDSLWRYIWAHTGENVAYKYAAHGNAIATADQGHLTGTLTIGPKPKIGGEAGLAVDQVFETRWDIDGEPVLDLGTGADPLITTIEDAGQGVGEQVTIFGSRFTGVTDVKFAAVSATAITFVSDSVLVVIIPAGTGAKNVTVITPEGTSNAVSYTVAS